jgi:hypothetical protein
LAGTLAVPCSRFRINLCTFSHKRASFFPVIPTGKAGVVNKDYLAQKALLARLDKGELQLADVQAKTRDLFEAELAKLN